MAAAGQERLEGVEGDVEALDPLYVVVACQQDGDGCECADQPRVDGRPQHGHEALADGFAVARCTVHQGCCAYARFVDIHGPARPHDGHAGQCTEACPEVERLVDNVQEELGNFRQVGQDDVEYKQEVRPHHDGDNLGGQARDALDATQYDCADDDAHDDADGTPEPNGVAVAHGGGKNGDERFGQLVGLHDAQASYHAYQAEEDGQGFPFFSQPVADDVHWAALGVPQVVFALVHDGERSLKEFRAHSDKGADPHPEDGPRTAHDDGNGHAGNVSHPNRGTDGAHEGLEGGNLPLALLDNPEGVDGLAQAAQGDSPRVDEEEQAAANEPHEQGVSAYEVAYERQDVLGCHWK